MRLLASYSRHQFGCLLGREGVHGYQSDGTENHCDLGIIFLDSYQLRYS